eukprot:CAMPEP_0119043534 /NCGR_PEP_ID=MMETSP1177-20130426/23149_1 /TAXON_ID=2985 /ORGANISM="Ochromonas sp, Strain CCMP1899" /LENGTH=100 /DNA_ID=CAMNT_0007011835 /DNA_START=379 /DNA_END=678 /DNA_ORIENTATION=-
MAQKYNSLPTGEYDDDDDSDRRGQQSLQHDRRMREQDSSLEMLGGSVLRLGQLSLGISEEIDSQNIMLNKLEVDVETAHENVNLLTKTTQTMVKKAGGSK